MNISAAASNTIVMNKYIWMCRQLHNFKDVDSIINWVNAMISVKSLLFVPPPAAHFPIDPQPLSSHPSDLQPFSANTRQSTQHDYSIARPRTISFNPSMTGPLTLSPTRSSDYEPSIPPSLTTYTLRLPNICPEETPPQCPKRRKLNIPPSVDYHAFITPKLGSSTITPKLSTSATPTQTKEMKVQILKNTLWNVLDYYQKQRWLFTGSDHQAPTWVHEEAEIRLQLPVNTLDRRKEFIRKTTSRYYNHHGRRPLK